MKPLLLLSSVEIASGLIRIPSVTPDAETALNFCEELLKPYDFRCRRLAFKGGGSYAVDNLYARFGTAAPHICFLGHVDVVPPGDSAQWKHDPFLGAIEDGYLYGRGAEDMKAAIAAFISAAINVVREGRGGSISILLTGDEEGDGVNGTRRVLEALNAEGEKFDAAIVGEPTNPEVLGEMAKNGRRGSITTKILFRGAQGHVAYPHLADNPVTRLVSFLDYVKSYKLDAGSEYFPPSNLEVTAMLAGSGADNVIPASAEATFNIRFNNSYTSASLKAWVEQAAARFCKDFEVQYKVTGEAFLTKKGMLSDMLVAAVQEITGVTTVLSTTGGTSDARFMKDYCPVIEFGATGLTAHKVNERVRVKDIEALTEVYLNFLRRFLSEYKV